MPCFVNVYKVIQCTSVFNNKYYNFKENIIYGINYFLLQKSINN